VKGQQARVKKTGKETGVSPLFPVARPPDASKRPVNTVTVAGDGDQLKAMKMGRW
jgi:hypothetical protein